MNAFTFSEVHISTICAGDVVEHNGKAMTVNAEDITKDDFMGTKLFGDSYNIGYKPVLKAQLYPPYSKTI